MTTSNSLEQSETDVPENTTSVNFILMAQLIAGIAVEMEKVASQEIIDSAKEKNQSVRAYLAREFANEFWVKYGFNNGYWKQLRIQFLEKNQDAVVKRHVKVAFGADNVSTNNSIKDLERWAFNDLVEYWAKNSERTE